jgi:hypothetical protein
LHSSKQISRAHETILKSSSSARHSRGGEHSMFLTARNLLRHQVSVNRRQKLAIHQEAVKYDQVLFKITVGPAPRRRSILIIKTKALLEPYLHVSCVRSHGTQCTQPIRVTGTSYIELLISVLSDSDLVSASFLPAMIPLVILPKGNENFLELTTKNKERRARPCRTCDP